MTATVAADGTVATSGSECTAKEGLRDHVLALLRLVALLKGQGYEEPPLQVSCTELPQQWRRPRGTQIAAASVDDADWRSVREGGTSKPIGSRLYNASKRPRDIAEMQDAMKNLGNELGSLGDFPFTKHLRCVQVLGTDCTFGVVPEGSLLTYQQSLSPHGLSLMSAPT